MYNRALPFPVSCMTALLLVVLISAVAVSSEIVVDFPDPNLEATIREAIGKPTGDIYASDLTLLTSLWASPKGIADLSGLEYCTNLTTLNLFDNQITDISALSGLTNLTYLNLCRNQITDISALSGLTNLTALRLHENLISDISALSGLTNLTGLNLRWNQISDISALSGLTSLTWLLDLSHNEVADLTALSSLTNLDWLLLGRNQITDISALSGLTKLTMLSLYYNYITDISAVSGLTKLAGLVLEGNQITDLSALSGLTGLTRLYLDWNQITNISPLSGLTGLTELCLNHNQITDIGPLVDNTGMNSGDNLELTGNPLSAISISDYIPELQARGVCVTYSIATLAIETTSLPNAGLGAPYSEHLEATGGVTPYAWSIVSGSLPDGLSLNSSTGVISGTPTSPETANFTVQVTDSQGTPDSDTQALSIYIESAAPADLVITTMTLPDGQVGVAYSQTVSATGGVTPYTWSVVSGSLPTGLDLDTGTGVISGTPAGAGTSTFAVQVADSESAPETATKALSIVVAPASGDLPAPVLSAPSNGSTKQSTTPTFVWSAVSGATSYRIMVATNSSDLPAHPMASTGGSSVVINDTSTTANYIPSTALALGVTYYWEVHARNSTQYGTWSNVSHFTTQNGAATVELPGGVPYIHQYYDTADDFVYDLYGPDENYCGFDACNATSALMAIQYYGILPATEPPLLCTRGGAHTSNYGAYISRVYSYNGHTYDIPSAYAPPFTKDAGFYGGFGYYLQDPNGTSDQRHTRLSEYISNHGLMSSRDYNNLKDTGFAKICNEIDAGYPVVVLTNWYGAGHFITCIGYVRGQKTLIFNDPYGDYATCSKTYLPQPNKNGARVFYDWPDADNGHPKLDPLLVIYARGLKITTLSLPYGVVATSDSQPLHVTGGTAPYTWSVVPGSLPYGVVSSSDSQPLHLAGGTTPYTWSVVPGSLPAGLSLDSSTGIIGGTPTTSGTSRFTVQVSDSQGRTATKDLSITVVPADPGWLKIDKLRLGLPASVGHDSFVLKGSYNTWPGSDVPASVTLTIDNWQMTVGASSWKRVGRSNIYTCTQDGVTCRLAYWVKGTSKCLFKFTGARRTLQGSLINRESIPVRLQVGNDFDETIVAGMTVKNHVVNLSSVSPLPLFCPEKLVVTRNLRLPGRDRLAFRGNVFLDSEFDPAVDGLMLKIGPYEISLPAGTMGSAKNGIVRYKAATEHGKIAFHLNNRAHTLTVIGTGIDLSAVTQDIEVSLSIQNHAGADWECSLFMAKNKRGTAYKY